MHRKETNTKTPHTVFRLLKIPSQRIITAICTQKAPKDVNKNKHVHQTLLKQPNNKENTLQHKHKTAVFMKQKQKKGKGARPPLKTRLKPSYSLDPLLFI